VLFSVELYSVDSVAEHSYCIGKVRNATVLECHACDSNRQGLMGVVVL
jgi:hypothetical protein